ncbi:unnamed protein product [Paramecium pentaurelia]|uniref:PPM-type phosphatase domain-containing protein n=1 Tax=Paramecium pentaurelia TaxID=43138 RepID=A0A8S1XPY6_9CILI|nr:unnamed protein product [Paramecium pentaurelia]
MFQKFGQQLKPIINRSSSENKKEQPIAKPNYHFTQKRDRSESRVQQSTVEDQNQNSLKPQSNLIQSVPAQRLTIKLPDLKGYQKQMEKSTSGADLTKKPPLLKNRLILDSKTKQQLQGQQSLLTQTLPIKSQREESQTTQQQGKNKIKITHYSQSRAGFDGIQEKTNQDRELCLQLDDNNYAFAVMDGHGMDGEYVSSFIKELLKYNLTKFYKVFDFQKVFFEMHQKMKFQTEFGCQFSGSTLTVLLIRENTISCGWVGDSRAILVKRNNNNNNLNVVELSIDHKPHLENERQRIEQNGGVVDTYHLPNGAPIGPSRVWARGAQFPGLAMSRSLGDTVAAAIGVSQTPDIKQLEIDNKEDIFIVLGSDGIWEFLDNQSIAELVYPFYQKNDAQGACQKIIQESVAGWKAHSEGIDDITAIVIFFQYEL